MLGKDHHNRKPRGSFLAWKKTHWPSFAALSAGDVSRYLDLCDARDERDRANLHLTKLCSHCGAVMIYRGCGIWTCPYEFSEAHELAREYYRGARGRGRLDRRRRSPGAPHPCLPHAAGINQEVSCGYLASASTA